MKSTGPGPAGAEEACSGRTAWARVNDTERERPEPLVAAGSRPSQFLQPPIIDTEVVADLVDHRLAHHVHDFLVRRAG